MMAAALALVRLLGPVAWIAATTVTLVAWDWLIDDPAVRREARAEYVAIAEVERIKADLKRERELRALAERKQLELQLTRAGQARALAEFEARLKAAETTNQDLNDEITELLARPDIGLPAVRDLGVGDRLRQR